MGPDQTREVAANCSALTSTRPSGHQFFQGRHLTGCQLDHAAMTSAQGVMPAVVASALTARISVEPGTTVPTTGMASDSASRKTARKDSCGCAPTKSTNPALFPAFRPSENCVLTPLTSALVPEREFSPETQSRGAVFGSFDTKQGEH